MNKKEHYQRRGFVTFRDFFSAAQAELIKDMSVRLESTCQRLMDVEDAGIGVKNDIIHLNTVEQLNLTPW